MHQTQTKPTSSHTSTWPFVPPQTTKKKRLFEPQQTSTNFSSSSSSRYSSFSSSNNYAESVETQAAGSSIFYSLLTKYRKHDNVEDIIILLKCLLPNEDGSNL
ncbi:hypothetical protein BLOT_001056 [Blomia tropicalis]|nr:hypothetical protein BLOT_001056 [Blomia tropicalis]